jgi:hypothetical protein
MNRHVSSAMGVAVWAPRGSAVNLRPEPRISATYRHRVPRRTTGAAGEIAMGREREGPLFTST